MKRSIAICNLALGLGTAAALLSGCTGAHPAIREGDAASVQIDYTGDPASAWPLARRHCAQFERVPRFVDAGIGETGLDVAYFDCVRP